MKKEQDLLFYGAGKLGRQIALHFDVSQGGDFNVIGFIDDTLAMGADVVLGKKVVGNRLSLANPSFSYRTCGLAITIGYSDLKARYRCYDFCRDLDYEFPNLVSSQASLASSVRLGSGNIILPGSVLDTEVSLGDINYIDLGCLISHQCTIGNNNFLCLGNSLAGEVKMGDHNFIGMDCSLTDGINVGDSNFIGARTLVSYSLGSGDRLLTVFDRQHVNTPKAKRDLSLQRNGEESEVNFD